MVKKIIAFLKIILFNPIMIQTLITGFNFKLHGFKRTSKMEITVVGVIPRI